jgi:hypothetical protein
MRHPLIVAELCALAACALSGCSHEDGLSQGTSMPTSGVTAAMPADRPSSDAAELDRLQRHFETLNDACDAADWSHAQAVLRAANADWGSIAPAQADAGVSHAMLDGIALNLRLAERAATNRDRRPCASVAQGLSLAATKLAPSMPPGEAHRARLRVWLRRLDADAHYRDFDAARRDLFRARAEWTLLESEGQSDEAAPTIEAALAACEGAIEERTQRPLRHAAHAALDALD